MVSAMIEQVGDDIKTAILASSEFNTASGWTIIHSAKDEDEDVDYEYDVPNIIYGAESVPTDYFMDGSRIMTYSFTFVVNLSEFTTDSTSLTRRRLVNYKLDKLQDLLNDMTFSSITPIQFTTSGGEGAAMVPMGEDSFLYRGSVVMEIDWLDET